MSQKKIKHFAALPEEVLIDEAHARVWNFRSPLPIIIGIAVVGMLIPIFGLWFLPIGIIAIVYLVWFSTYLIRERWRLSLTDKQIVARQLFPRPFTFFTKDFHFPLNQIEGLTTGPRTFRLILLVGVFLTTNVGVNLLITYFSGGTEYPTTIDAIAQIFHGITFLSFMGDAILNAAQFTFNTVLPATQLLLGIIFTSFGLVMIIITIPRRDHIQIRVRHGADFRLYAGIPRTFWHKCYKEIYKEKIVEAPKEYRKWRFQWFQDEEVLASADLEQTIHISRIVGLFAIYIGVQRLIEQFQLGFEWNDGQLVGWLALTIVDMLIAATTINFAKKKNEMLVTNKRIIFAREEKDISGTVGRRLFTLSDIKRDDVAGFNFHKIKAFSFGYLFIALLFIGLLIFYWSEFSIFVIVLSIALILFSLAFVNQTFVQFNVLTKGGETWAMRHQLSNPMTIVRELMGGEDQKIITAIFSNRLEEREIIEVVQTVRSVDLNLDQKEFNRKSRALDLDHLLLKGEDVVFKTNVSRRVPRRVLTLTIATLILLSWMSPAVFTINGILSGYTFGNTFQPLIIAISVVSILAFLIIGAAIWAKYYSLFHASLIITKDRLFFQDIKSPILPLYLMGIHRETILHESLRDQVHSTYTSRQFNQKESLLNYIRHTWKWFLFLIIYGLVAALFVFVVEIRRVKIQPFYISETANSIIIVLTAILLTASTINVAWHASNAYVEMIKGWPKRVFNAKGIGVHHEVPFLKSEKAKMVNYSIWSGMEMKVK